MNRGIVLSDLHLFSNRSRGHSILDSVEADIDASDALVLNGDIFDFRWAGKSHHEAVPEAIDWLGALTSRFPETHIYFIPGNHDCLPTFTKEVAGLSGIKYHEDYLFLGDNVFLHGDPATYRMDTDRFRSFRKKWETESRHKGELSRNCYPIADWVRLNHAIHHLWFRGNRACHRIEWHLDQSVPGWKERVNHCFFGHTHIPFSDREVNGIYYHNTGSGLKRQTFSPAQFNY